MRSMNRRRLIALGARLTLASQLPRVAFADYAGDARLVVAILRGGLDGLAAVPPYGEPRYTNLRRELAISPPDGSDGARKLDGLFALHPALETLHGLYLSRELTVVPAVATPYRERSHFDGQEILENGGTRADGTRDGWLNRSLGTLPGAADRPAIALVQNVPLLLRGDASVTTWVPSPLPEADSDLLDRIADLYAYDSLLSGRLHEALTARALLDGVTSEVPLELPSDTPAGAGGERRSRNRDQGLRLAAAAGRFLGSEDGPRIAVLESRGWDTHANQGADQGALANRLARLDASIAVLRESLGDVWSRTAVLVVTEFGRTAAENGTRGTDHGTGGCAFLAGGAVRGGRVIGDWPGLAERDLLDGRDLRPMVDLRGVLKGVLRDHLGVEDAQLHTRIFPASTSVPAIDGLIAS